MTLGLEKREWFWHKQPFELTRKSDYYTLNYFKNSFHLVLWLVTLSFSSPLSIRESLLFYVLSPPVTFVLLFILQCTEHLLLSSSLVLPCCLCFFFVNKSVDILQCLCCRWLDFYPNILSFSLHLISDPFSKVSVFLAVPSQSPADISSSTFFKWHSSSGTCPCSYQLTPFLGDLIISYDYISFTPLTLKFVFLSLIYPTLDHISSSSYSD
jgi:hypothetical protein